MCKKIFQFIKDRKISQYQLAQAIGISAGNISDWKYKRCKPSIKALKKIADYLGVVLEDLIEDDSENLDQSINIKITDSTLNNSEVTGIKSITSSAKDEYIKKVSELMEEMTTEGKERMVDQAEFLKSKYKK